AADPAPQGRPRLSSGMIRPIRRQSTGARMATGQGHASRRRRLLCALPILSVLLAGPAQAIAALDGAPAALQSEMDDDAALDQQAVNREIERFRTSAISLSQAMAIAQATHAAS